MYLRGVTELPNTDIRAPARAANAAEFRLFSARKIPQEIAFLADFGVSADTLRRAAEIADRAGAPALSALLAEGFITEEHYARALADRLGLPYYAGKPELKERGDPNAAIRAGFIALEPDESGARAVLAPSDATVSYLLEGLEEGRAPPPISICSRQRLNGYIRNCLGAPIARHAARDLTEADPSLSALGGLNAAQIAIAVLAALAAIALSIYAPSALRVAISLVLWLAFAGGIWLRTIAVAASDTPEPSPPLEDRDLPVYSVIVALYREASVVRRLVQALDALDYPKAKLDIKLVLERDDRETLAAVAALRLPARYDVIVAPPGAPRTKPRALNVALAVAHGELVVVYDAEDIPDPDQLRKAAHRFHADRHVDCLQARLTIENPDDSWLSALFAIEYAVLFDLVNPGLAALDLVVALGGTSNHFRARTLRRVGGWDAWNVTEDADLGIRLARFGARVGALASDTAEEAPNELGNWFRQRVRWQKGWMQTLVVHSRRPDRFVRELGGLRALYAALLILGAVLSGLFGAPLLFDALARSVLGDPVGFGWGERAGDVITYLLMLAGAHSVVASAVVAMRRRRMRNVARALALMPAYYLLVGAATWIALFELAIRPFYWGKTAHGRIRRSTSAAALDAAQGRSPRPLP